MEELMQTEWLREINAHRNQTLPPWTRIPQVMAEETSQAVFDIIDVKDTGGTLFRPKGQGNATYYNGCGPTHPCLRFIHNEDFFNQFCVRNPLTHGVDDWARGLSRPDYLAYDASPDRSCFIVHELSEGKIASKRPKAIQQILNMVRWMHRLPDTDAFCQSFSRRLCIITAVDSPSAVATPNDMAAGFMDIYSLLPDPNPVQNKSIERMGFEAIETKCVKL
jgi:hypothetical protein